MNETLFTLDNTDAGRRELDWYPTPSWCVTGMLEALGFRVEGARVLDPSCGDGSILDTCVSLGAVGLGLELDERRAAVARSKGHQVAQCDALSAPWLEPDLVIGNPPFELGLEFAVAAAAWAARMRRPAVLLLPQSFLASATRYSFHVENVCDMVVVPSRPQFRSDRTGGDKKDVAWFAFYPGATRRMFWMPPHERKRVARGRKKVA